MTSSNGSRHAQNLARDRRVARSDNLVLPVAIMTVVALAGCNREPRTDNPPQGLIVFVDLKTTEPVIDLATTEVPAINPETGERTLMPGLYCRTCQRWHPTPAFDTLQRTPGAGRCPRDGTALISDGPWPTGEHE